MITVGVSVKIENNITYVKNVVFEILQHVAVKMANMQEVLLVIQQLHAMKLQKKKNYSNEKYFNKNYLLPFHNSSKLKEISIKDTL